MQRLQQLRSAIRSENPQVAIQSLINSNRVGLRQIDANRTQIESTIITLVNDMIQHVPGMLKKTDKPVIQRFGRQLNAFRNHYRMAMSTNTAKDMQSLMKLGNDELLEKNASDIIGKLQNQLQNESLMKESAKQSSKMEIRLQNARNSILNTKADSTIQGQIAPIAQYLSRNLQPMNPTTLPQSIQILANYAESKNKKRFGPISGSKSRAYIGVSEQQNGLHSQLVPFPQQKGVGGNTPNLMLNFNFFAGKAVNAWNNFVRKEQDLVDYMNKVSTKELRKQFVQQRISQMTEATFQAESLATLVYYYVQIPLERFLRTHIERYDGTQQSFKQLYQPGDGASKNPFMISKDSALKIYNELFEISPPAQRVIAISKILDTLKTGFNTKKINQWKTHTKLRSAVSKQFFQTSGLSPEQISRTMNSGYIIGIKEKKFTIPPMFTNPEIVAMVNTVVEKRQDRSQNSKLWTLQWGSDRMMSHDYVWNYQI